MSKTKLILESMVSGFSSAISKLKESIVDYEQKIRPYLDSIEERRQRPIFKLGLQDELLAIEKESKVSDVGKLIDKTKSLLSNLKGGNGDLKDLEKKIQYKKELKSLNDEFSKGNQLVLKKLKETNPIMAILYEKQLVQINEIDNLLGRRFERLFMRSHSIKEPKILDEKRIVEKWLYKTHGKFHGVYVALNFHTEKIKISNHELLVLVQRGMGDIDYALEQLGSSSLKLYEGQSLFLRIITTIYDSINMLEQISDALKGKLQFDAFNKGIHIDLSEEEDNRAGKIATEIMTKFKKPTQKELPPTVIENKKEEHIEPLEEEFEEQEIERIIATSNQKQVLDDLDTLVTELPSILKRETIDVTDINAEKRRKILKRGFVRLKPLINPHLILEKLPLENVAQWDRYLKGVEVIPDNVMIAFINIMIEHDLKIDDLRKYNEKNW